MMNEPEKIVPINGPVVEIYQPAEASEYGFFQQIVYSVQLANGLILTSPEKFPPESPALTQVA